MARSKGVIISVKVPIKWESMTERSRQRLRQTVGRDTRVIRSFLGIIEQHEDELLTGRNKNRIDDSKLDELTMTALKMKPGFSQRLSVPHDMKSRFPRISTNELQECRQTAVALYESYLQLRQKRGRRASRPVSISSTRRIPRWMFSQRFKLVEKKTKIARWWLDIRDALDSTPKRRRVHDRLRIPLKMSHFHRNQIQRGEVKALQIFTDREGKWWVTLAIRLDLQTVSIESLPPAVLGVDLGIEKSACTTLVTPTKVRETRYFVQRNKVAAIKRYDRLVADLQSEMHNRQNRGFPHDKVAEQLRRIRFKRERVSKEYDRMLVHQLVEYISELSKKYTLYVSLGRLKHIRFAARRGNYKGRRFRGMIHSWAFSRITLSLQHKLAQLGWSVKGKNSRFQVVSEAWTSIMCWKCGSKGKRPKQNYFHCPNCGHKTNADRNGSINIAGRLITLTPLLHEVGGLGKWADAAQRAGKRSRPKAQRKKPSSQGKSLLSEEELPSGSGESAAVHHAQSSLLDFSDEVRMGDEDPAVVKNAERLTVTGSDDPAKRQEKETRTVGGIPSR